MIQESEPADDDDSQISLSLCKDLLTNEMNLDQMIQIHRQNRINFSRFCVDPYATISHPQLMIKIYDQFYAPEIGIPVVFA